MSSFILYGTSACHLCELAEQQLGALRDRGYAVAYRKVDIAADEDLLARYGIRIPVVRRAHDGRELEWPFEPADIQRLL